MTSLARTTDPVVLLRDALARVVWLREETDPWTRDQALADLEHDLAGALARVDLEDEA